LPLPRRKAALARAMCSRSGEWKQGRLDRFGHTLGFAPERYIVPGMSGSPIVSAAGAAIGVFRPAAKDR